MHEQPYTPPSYRTTSFNCPHCKAFSNMIWNQTYIHNGSLQSINELQCAHCTHCKQYSLWVEQLMVFPLEITVDGPNSDLPEEVQQDYLEAANILNHSPRGAAALLRLAIEKLVNGIEDNGKNLDSKIGNLVRLGLNSKIQKALDMVRVIGNNAVHPGQIDLTDDSDTAQRLFKLVNIIADGMITQPKEVSELYENLLPEGQKEYIKQRDSK